MKTGLGSIALLFFTCTAACSSAGRPAPSPDVVETPAPVSGATSTSCQPGSTRECRYYYVDLSGAVHCPIKTQYCRSDGLGWLPCGEPPDVGADEEPLRPEEDEEEGR